MTHQIRTNYGYLTITLSKKQTLVPFQGVIQGNRVVHTTWVLLSTPLLNMLCAVNNGGQWISPTITKPPHSIILKLLQMSSNSLWICLAHVRVQRLTSSTISYLLVLH